MNARAWEWLIGSDPGLLRLQQAGRTVLTLATALLVLYGLTTAMGQPPTVVLLGVQVAQMASSGVNESSRREQNITTALLPLVGALAVTLGALLAPHKIAADSVFVGIMFSATYVRRFGSRGATLGFVATMTYLLALFLGASIDQVPWLVVAIAIAAACALLMSNYVWPDRPERILHRTLQALWTRTAALVDAAAAALRSDRFNESIRRKLRLRAARLNDTALMVGRQLDDRGDTAGLPPGIDAGDLAVRLFDAELATERLASSAEEAAAAGGRMTAATRSQLVHTLELLRRGLHEGSSSEALAMAERSANHLLKHTPGSGDGPSAGEVQRLALAVQGLVAAVRQTRRLLNQSRPGGLAATGAGSSRQKSSVVALPRTQGHSGPAPASQPLAVGMLPTTRQAIQVAVATSLAIVAGDFLSPSRWFWAVITAFVIFSGTTSRGETLRRGWQRLIGTVIGVPAGVLVATGVGGNVGWSIILMLICVFGFVYFMKVAYSLAAFWLTTLLALLYGLLGQFSPGLLLLRIEETAIGAIIGVVVAMFLLPTSTRETVNQQARTFLAGLAGLVASAAQALLGEAPDPPLMEQARELGAHLQQLRTSAGPLMNGIVGVGGRGSVRRGLRVVGACDHHARVLARSSSQAHSQISEPGLSRAIQSAADEIGRNIGVLAELIARRQPASVTPATDLLDACVAMIERQPSVDSSHNNARLLAALRSMRSIDQAVIAFARDLGAAQVRPESAPVAMSV